MMDKKYNMSFTTGGLFYTESLKALEVYQKEQDWSETRKRILTENLIQARTQSTATRRVREICFRLEKLTDQQLRLLTTGTAQEQLYLLWVAVCKHHLLISDFVIKVLREKFLRMDFLLEPADYDIFFQEMAEWHNELEQLTDSTKAKLRQVLFKIMREAEILSKANRIIPGLLTQELALVLAEDNPVWLTVLPVSDADIKGWLEHGPRSE